MLCFLNFALKVHQIDAFNATVYKIFFGGGACPPDPSRRSEVTRCPFSKLTNSPSCNSLTKLHQKIQAENTAVLLLHEADKILQCLTEKQCIHIGFIIEHFYNLVLVLFPHHDLCDLEVSVCTEIRRSRFDSQLSHT